jgi:hypothetical protein
MNSRLQQPSAILGLALLLGGCEAATKVATEVAGGATRFVTGLNSSTVPASFVGQGLVLALSGGTTPLSLGGAFAVPLSDAFVDDTPTINVPEWCTLDGHRVVVLVHDKTEHSSALASMASNSVSSALQKRGVTINDHSAAARVVELLQQIEQNQDSATAKTKLDQLGVDDVVLVEIEQYEVRGRNPTAQDPRPYQLDLAVLIRSVDARTLELGLTGSIHIHAAVADEGRGSNRAHDGVERLAVQLEKALPARSPEPVAGQ